MLAHSRTIRIDATLPPEKREEAIAVARKELEERQQISDEEKEKK